MQESSWLCTKVKIKELFLQITDIHFALIV